MFELYLNKPNDLKLRDFEITSPIQDDEVKIKLIYGGICGSDLSVYKGKLAHASYPIRPGHELLGTIIEAGKDVELALGTRVVVSPNTFCGECDRCQEGNLNICQHKKSIGVNADGGFAEQFVISSKYVLPVPDEISDREAILIEPLSVVVHALEKVNIPSGSSVAVMGCGTQGMLAAALAYHAGARVTAIDINALKFNTVKKIGGIKAVEPEKVKGESFDVVIEAAGAQSSFEQGIELVRPGGSMVLVGMPQEANLPVARVVRGEITIYGSIIYNFPSDFAKSLAYLSKDGFHILPVISEIVPFKDYQQAYKMALSGNCGKIVLDFKEGNCA